MAANDVNIIISVKDLATAEINKIKKSLKGLNTATQDSATSTTKSENQSAAATKKAEDTKQKALDKTARTYKSLQKSMSFLYSGSMVGGVLGSIATAGTFKLAEMGAQSDELRISFEKTFGSGAGSLLNNIRSSVKGIVDDTTLMRNAVQANIAGVKNAGDIAQIFKLGAVASQRLGLDASEGLELARKATVEFNEGAMEQLGIINKLDPAYKTQLAVIEKATKGLGAYATIGLKIAYVQDQMAKRFGNTEVLEDNLQAFRFLGAALTNVRNNMLYIVGDALSPFIRKIAMATTEMVKFVGQLRNASAFKDGTIAVIKFVAGLGLMLTLLASLRFALLGLSLIFSGPFGLIGGFLALVGAFKMASATSGGFMDNLRKIGQMAQGVFQLLTSFDPNTGIAQIDADLAKSLGHDTLQNVVDIARNLESVIMFTKGFADGLGEVFKQVAKIAGMFGIGASNFEGWNNIGKVLGEIAGALAIILTPLIIVAGAFSKIAGAVNALRGIPSAVKSASSWVSKLSREVAPVATEMGDGAIATEGGAVAKEVAPIATELGEGAIAAEDAAAMGALGLGLVGTATVGTGLGLGYGGVKAADAITKGRYSNFVGAPGAWLGEQIHGNNESSAFQQMVSLMSKMVNHLENLDGKTAKKNMYEDKLVAGGR